MWKAITDRIANADAETALVFLLMIGTGILGIVAVVCFTIYKVAELFAGGA